MFCYPDRILRARKICTYIEYNCEKRYFQTLKESYSRINFSIVRTFLLNQSVAANLGFVDQNHR